MIGHTINNRILLRILWLNVLFPSHLHNLIYALILGLFVKFILYLLVSFKYLNILITLFQSSIIVSFALLAAFDTGKIISYLVHILRYNKFQIMLLYFVSFTFTFLRSSFSIGIIFLGDMKFLLLNLI